MMALSSGLVRLDQALKAAGIPVDGEADISLSPPPYQSNWHVLTRRDGVILRIDYQATATAAQIQQGDALAMTFDLGDRGPRPLYAIYTDLQALSIAQKAEVWADLSSGQPKKYFLDAGPNAAAILVLDWAANDSGATGPALNGAKLRLMAFYVQDNPDYLVRPSFDPGIVIPGDQNV
jgi:hypothetical protein